MFIYVPIFYKKKKSTPFKEKLLQTKQLIDLFVF